MKPRVSIVRQVAYGTAGYQHTFTSYDVHRADGLLIHSGSSWAEAMRRANAEADAPHRCSAKAMLSSTVDEGGVLVCAHGVRLAQGARFVIGGSTYEVDRTRKLPRPISQRWALGKPIAF